MKKRSIFIISFFALLFFPVEGFIFNLGSAPLGINDNIMVDKFSSVVVAISATVYIEQGDHYNVDIEASSDAMDKIDVSVENTKLIIKPVYPGNLKGDIIIRIVAPDFDAITISGSGKLIAQENMTLGDVTLKISGSGRMIFERLSAEEVALKISGSGNIMLKGKGAEELEVSIAGSGSVNSTEFEVQELDAKISGSGGCKVYVTSELNATIAGSGSVYYKGNPEIVTSVAGSGKVKSL